MSDECDRFVRGSRKWHICNGTALGLSAAKRDQYLISWGMNPVVESPSEEARAGGVQVSVRRVNTPHVKTVKKAGGCNGCGNKTPARGAKMDGKGPGSQLIQIFKKVGFETCPACYLLAEKMDRWGAAGCRAKMGEIVADILPRALAWQAEKVGWFAKLIPDVVTRESIAVLVNRAIVSSEAIPTTAKWAYGVTTISERATTLLPKTLMSLKAAGFDDPRLFIDDNGDFDKFGLSYTTREPRVRTFGNWILGLSELLIRNPDADKFAMFQDDFVTCKNLRRYLEAVEWPQTGYLNLYTFPINQRLSSDRAGWYEAKVLGSGQRVVDQQTGYGAVGLVFSREAVITLLEQQTTITKPLREDNSWRRLDGVIALAMNVAGWREYVHNPSLVQHTGLMSSMGNKRHPLATSFPGEEFDAMMLLKEQLV